MKSLFDGLEQREISFGGFTGKAPMFCRNVHLMGAVFSADRAVVSGMLDGTGLRPLRLPLGRAAVAIHAIEYGETDVGPYNELALSLLVRPGLPVAPGALALVTSDIFNRFHGYIQELPVTTEISVEGGRRVFNYPKYLAEITFRETADHRICTVRDPDSKDLILEVESMKLPGKGRSGRTLNLNSYPTIDGVPSRALTRLRTAAHGTSHAINNVFVRTGAHPRAESFAALRLGRSWHCLYAPQCEAVLFGPEKR